MSRERADAGTAFLGLLLCGLSLSIGWGVRGNWGHEYGAMIPGALTGVALAIASGREDWRRRAAYFAFFGALGWSFGGSMSYGLVQGYTHSGHLPSVLYGYACLFLMGFLWGALGGAGTALPAVLCSRRLHEYFPVLLAVFAAWALEDAVFALSPGLEAAWDWHDTDWIAAGLAPLAAVLVASVRRRRCEGFRLVIHAAAGWWAGFLGLVVVCNLRMTPPRGDNWAGVLGMTAGVAVYLARRRLHGVLIPMLITGIWGGVGFPASNWLRAALMKLEWHTNPHSIFEQTYGFLNGVGIALALGWLQRRQPMENEPMENDPVDRSRWSEPFAVGFTLLAITYLNIRKNLDSVWLPGRTVPAEMYGIPAGVWFHLAYGVVAVVVVAAILRHRRRPLALLPASSLGRAQGLYLLLLWWIVVGNLSRYLPFDPVRLVTEGVVHVNACLASLLVLCVAWESPSSHEPLAIDVQSTLRRSIIACAVAFIVVTAATTAATRAVWGDQSVPGAGHVRFGPGAWQPK